MGNLLVNEWRKVWLKKSSWIMLLFIPVMVFGMAFLMNRSQNSGYDYMKDAYGEDFVDKGGILVAEDASGQQISENDYYSLQSEEEYNKYHWVSLTAEETVPFLEKEITKVRQREGREAKQQVKELEKNIAYYQAYVDKGVTPPSSLSYKTTSAEFASNLGGMYVLTTICAVIVASTMIAAEFSGGTIKLLLTRPYSRSQILLSKYLVTIFYSLLATVILVFAAYLSSLMFSHQSLNLPISMATGAKTGLTLMLELIGSNTILMLFYITVAFFFSAVVRSQALAVGIGLGCLFSGSISGQLMPMLVEKYNWTKWVIFNLLNLNNQVMGQGYEISGNLNSLEMVLGIFVYTGIIAALTFFLFNKRDVALS